MLSGSLSSSDSTDCKYGLAWLEPRLEPLALLHVTSSVSDVPGGSLAFMSGSELRWQDQARVGRLSVWQFMWLFWICAGVLAPEELHLSHGRWLLSEQGC